jgi:hypothetical protein
MDMPLNTLMVPKLLWMSSTLSAGVAILFISFPPVHICLLQPTGFFRTWISEFNIRFIMVGREKRSGARLPKKCCDIISRKSGAVF